METQITLRLPLDMARRLARQAKARGAKKSQLVREAVSLYLERVEGESPDQQWTRIAPMIGSIRGSARSRDPLADGIYQQNVRE